MTIIYGSVFIDPGAIWTDNVDGSGTILVATSGSVNISVPGTYTLTYRKIDTAGNISNTVTRTVMVGTAPTYGGGGGGGGGGGSNSFTPTTPITPTTPTLPPVTPVLSPTPDTKMQILPTQSYVTPAGKTQNNQNIYTIENRVTDYICPQIVQVFSENDILARDIQTATVFTDDLKSMIMFRGLEQDEQTNGQTFEEYQKYGIANNDASFDPNNNITRAEYVKMLIRALSCRYQKE